MADREAAAIHQDFWKDPSTHVLTPAAATLRPAIALGAVVALALGGLGCLQHLLLRLLLPFGGAGPLRYRRYLDAAVRIGLLHRIGGGYAFYHRELLLHLAGPKSPSSPPRRPR
jgi:hypothetical protein